MKRLVAKSQRSAARSQLSLGMFVGLALLVSNHVVGCGDSSTDSPDPSTGNNNPAPNNGSPSSSSTGGSSSTSGTPNTESTPNAIPLDPNRDQTVPINLLASGAVQCGGGDNYCVQPNRTCCTVGMGGDAMNSCAPNAAACPAGTTSSASCSSQASCGTGQVCCRTGGGGGDMGPATSTCAASCPMGSVQVCLEDEECGAGNQCNNNETCGPIPCTATSCGGGELCCRNQGGGGGNNVAACVAPGGDGLCPNNQRQVCTTDAGCPATFTCTPQGGGGGGGGVMLCIPPPCTTTSCMGGQVCCVGGQVGGNPTCSAANAGACPGNSRLLCVTDADCAPTAGTLCLLNPNNGMGPLSCRVPPPPPADAGAGDAG
jgi:hypothetical protein